MVGMSLGNGHPFSFSAIINGYSPTAFANAGWPVIDAYLRAAPEESFGFPDTRVTHAWTQERDVTASLCAACAIDHACDDYEELVQAVDLVIIARDDWSSHFELAKSALDAGRMVFVDKPLTLDPIELEQLRPYLESAHLMSTSGLRYARELDALRADRDALGDVVLIEAVVLNDLDTYGVHLLDALSGLGLGPPVAGTRMATPHQGYLLELADGTPMTLHCLGSVGRTFKVSIFGTQGHFSADLHDNFTAFRRTLAAFFVQCRDRQPAVAPNDVVSTMGLIVGLRDLGPGQHFRMPDA